MTPSHERSNVQFYSNKVILRMAIVIAILGLLLSTIPSFLPSEPSYKGKKLSQWAEDLSFPSSGQPDNRSALERKKHVGAVDAVRHIGTKSLPLALEFCQANDSSLAETLREPMVSRFNVHIPYADEKWRIGLGIIRILGTNANPAIPTLIGFLHGSNPTAADNATVALGWIGVDAAAPLMDVLTNGSKEARGYAAWGLGCIGSSSYAAIPILLRYISDEDPELRRRATYALTKISDDPSIVVPALIKFLKDKNNRSPFWLFGTLGHFGTNALPAVPELTEYIESNRYPEYAAMSALCRIDLKTGTDFIKKYEVLHTNFSAFNFINLQKPLQSNPPSFDK